jgi:triosephosphate isomerase
MNEKNAKELLGKQNIDGGLIGGAALKADSYLKIIEAGC